MNILSVAQVDRLDENGEIVEVLVDPILDPSANASWPAPTAEDPLLVSGNHTHLAGSAYADGTGVWGASANGFFTRGGVRSTVVYTADFEKTSDAQIVTSRFSNLFLSISDFGAGEPEDIVARLELGFQLSTGGAVVGSDLYEAELFGRRGPFGSFGGVDPDAAPYFLETANSGSGGAVLPTDFIIDYSETEDLAQASFPTFLVTFDLSEIDVGEVFTIQMRGVAEVFIPGGETFAEARLWDPLSATPVIDVFGVPEPSGAVLLFVASAFLLRMRRRAI